MYKKGLSKRGNFKKNMELKKILIIITFILFSNTLNAESITQMKNYYRTM